MKEQNELKNRKPRQEHAAGEYRLQKKSMAQFVQLRPA
jgi:hypothetical protein